MLFLASWHCDPVGCSRLLGRTGPHSLDWFYMIGALDDPAS